MTLYAESSAVLAWLLEEPAGPAILEALEAAEFIVTSDLTLVECDRALHRMRDLGQLSTESFTDIASQLRSISKGWMMLRLSEEVVTRARGRFPAGPIRSLDALHLASALTAQATIPEIAILSLDERVRRCGRELGFGLLPP